jgi:hypothetical protein
MSEQFRKKIPALMLAMHYGPKKIPCLESVKNTSASQGGGVFTQKSVADYMPRMEEMLC